MSKYQPSVFARLKAATEGLPDIVESTSYGEPSLKVGKKFLARVRDGDVFVLVCPLEEKAMLMEAAPEIYFETAHYKGWPAVLARSGEIGAEELRHRIERAWRMQAGKRLVAAYDAGK